MRSPSCGMTGGLWLNPPLELVMHTASGHTTLDCAYTVTLSGPFSLSFIFVLLTLTAIFKLLTTPLRCPERLGFHLTLTRLRPCTLCACCNTLGITVLLIISQSFILAGYEHSEQPKRHGSSATARLFHLTLAQWTWSFQSYLRKLQSALRAYQDSRKPGFISILLPSHLQFHQLQCGPRHSWLPVQPVWPE